MPTAQLTYNVTKEYAEELFGLHNAYTLEDLREAFRTLAAECHPDMAKNEADLIEREARCRIVNMSYARLKRQFIGNGDITVKTMDEMIKESTKQSYKSNVTENKAVDDILDFLDDIDDDIAPTAGTIPSWMQYANNHIDDMTNRVKSSEQQYAHVDWQHDSVNIEYESNDDVVYSLPPFLRSKYLHRTEKSYQNIDKYEYRNQSNDDRPSNCGVRTKMSESVHTREKPESNIESEVDKIMAKILHDTGCC